MAASGFSGCRPAGPPGTGASPKEDDTWAYLPALRRVRRIAATQKSDSLLGTEFTLEDFYIFAGYVWDHQWEFKGESTKLGVINSTHHFGRLAAGAWGDEKTLDFIKKLAGQKPLLTRAGEMAQRLILGEVLVTATLQDSQLHEAKESGAPRAFAEKVSPVVSPEYHVGVIKNAPHPNVGHLMVAFMASAEVQPAWLKYTGHTSAYVPGTAAYKFVQGKQVIYMKQDQADKVDKISRQIGKILGFD